MQKNIILTSPSAGWLTEPSFTSLFIKQKMAETMKKTLNPLMKYYASVLERPVDLRQTLLLVMAQVAFALAVLPVECPLVLRAAFALWFGWSVRVCKRSLRSGQNMAATRRMPATSASISSRVL